MTPKVITMCHCNRPEYTRQSLEALAKCDGIDEYAVNLFQDWPRNQPFSHEVKSLLDASCAKYSRPGREWTLVVPPASHRGVNRMTSMALLSGFAARGANFVIHVEDDILLAPDALRYFEFCANEYEGDRDVFTVTAYNRLQEQPPQDQWHRIERREWFHGWGWGTWRNRYEEFRQEISLRAKETWDVHLHKYVMHRPRRRVEIHPTLSRSQNIGVQSSIHQFTPEWHAVNQHVKHYAGDLEVPAGRWAEDVRQSAEA